jgi:translation initiation factor 5B
MIRKIIVSFVGHVDHGKTSILDFIRKSSVAKAEAGGITQKISSIDIPIETIKKTCGILLDQLKLNITIPGLLAIDTPGHASFTNLRKRGGNLADIAVLVIDINEGIKPQTLESIEILKNSKTPFVIAANKIDNLSGWHTSNKFLLDTINSHSESLKKVLDDKIYHLVAKLAELNISSERFDRVDDYTKQVAIVPVSAKTGDGIPEILMILTGLAQKYLEKNLQVDTNLQGKATILEIKEEKGLGKTLEIILYDGSIKKDDKILIGSIDKPIETKVKALFILDKGKLKPVDKAEAACDIKLIAHDLEDAFSGMPLRVANKDKGEIKKQIQEEVDEVLIETDKQGLVIKADSLGSLEALIGLLKEKNIKIKRASIGNINKNDIAIASSEEDPLNKIVLGFNVKLDADKEDIKVINYEIVYKIIEELEEYIVKKKKEIEFQQLESITKPCKIQILKGYVFRQSNPAIVGVEVLGGTLKTGIELAKDGEKLAEVKAIQSEGKNIDKAEQGKEVAVSLPGVTVGRQINEEDILYSNVTEEDFRKLKDMKKLLSKSEIEVLKEFAEIKRKTNSVWGI